MRDGRGEGRGSERGGRNESGEAVDRSSKPRLKVRKRKMALTATNLCPVGEAVGDGFDVSLRSIRRRGARERRAIFVAKWPKAA